MRQTIIWFLIFAAATSVTGQSHDLTYQGRLVDGTVAAAGPYDFIFKLFDEPTDLGGAQIGVDQVRDDVPVSGGIFSVALNFGSTAFGGGGERYLEIYVRPGAGAGAYTKLTPRHRVTSAPYAIKSLNSDNAVMATNSLQLDGRPAGDYVLSTDPRMSDARTPTAGSGLYIQNRTGSAQTGANFDIGGNGLVRGNLTVFGTFNGVLNQTGHRAYGTAGLSLTNNAFTPIPGMTLTFTAPPANGFVQVSTWGGIQTTSASATGFSTVDIVIYVDGVVPANGGWRRCIVANTGGLTQQMAYWNISDVVFFNTAATTHTIDVRASLFSGAPATVSGNNGTVLQGTLNVAVIRNVAGP